MKKSILTGALAGLLSVIGISHADELKGEIMGKKNLVVYFSVHENTKKLAETIHAQVGGDIVRIDPVVAYMSDKSDYEKLADYAKNERDTDARPQYKDLGVNISDYDNIFVGYPIWWYTLPMIMYTFFDNNDFAGKTIIPFNTHEGSSDGGTYKTIAEWEPNATVLPGLPIRGENMANDQSDAVKSWLEKIGK